MGRLPKTIFTATVDHILKINHHCLLTTAVLFICVLENPLANSLQSFT